MTTLMQRLGLQLPEWARPEHPHLRFELKSMEQVPRRRRLLRALGFALVVVVLYVGGYLQATDFLQSYNPFTSWDASDPLRTLFPGQNLTEGLMMVWFWPTLILQALAAVLALAMTVNTVSEQKRRQTWDNLRATEGGVKLGFRTRWVALALVPVLLGATWVHMGNGWVFSGANGGWEYPVFLIAVSFASALLGSGAYALDNVIGNARVKATPARA